MVLSIQVVQAFVGIMNIHYMMSAFCPFSNEDSHSLEQIEGENLTHCQEIIFDLVNAFMHVAFTKLVLEERPRQQRFWLAPNCGSDDRIFGSLTHI